MIHLVLGGARSGKSRWAETIAQNTAEETVTYVATATAGDDEMAARIARHKKDRTERYGKRHGEQYGEQHSNRWSLIEEPLFLSAVVHAAKKNHVLLIDCLTLYLSNWLCAIEQGDDSLAPDKWGDEKVAFLQALEETEADIVLVSNEVGSGIVPLGELSRHFVDEAGWLNQAVSDIADDVTLVVAGCPLPLKRKGRLRPDIFNEVEK